MPIFEFLQYALVIGMVIAVYMLYLLSYSSIQVLHYIRTNWNSRLENVVLRNTFKLLFGMHAVLQPLCYFRIKDFRVLVRSRLRRIFPCFCQKSTEEIPGGYTGIHSVGYTGMNSVGYEMTQHRPSTARSQNDETLTPRSVRFSSNIEDTATKPLLIYVNRFIFHKRLQVYQFIKDPFIILLLATVHEKKCEPERRFAKREVFRKRKRMGKGWKEV